MDSRKGEHREQGKGEQGLFMGWEGEHVWEKRFLLKSVLYFLGIHRSKRKILSEKLSLLENGAYYTNSALFQ